MLAMVRMWVRMTSMNLGDVNSYKSLSGNVSYCFQMHYVETWVRIPVGTPS